MFIKKKKIVDKYEIEIRIIFNIFFDSFVLFGKFNFPGCKLENITFSKVKKIKAFYYIIFS